MKQETKNENSTELICRRVDIDVPVLLADGESPSPINQQGLG
jgi:hypothetical protein